MLVRVKHEKPCVFMLSYQIGPPLRSPHSGLVHSVTQTDQQRESVEQFGVAGWLK